MAITPAEELQITEDDLDPLVATVRQLGDEARGWVNLVPEVEPGHEPPPRSAVSFLFSSRGAAVPLATWTAPPAPGQRATVGIEHGSGPRAVDRLVEAELPLGAGWIKVGDHPRRGLVAATPVGADAHDVVWWLLAASHVLSPVPLTGAWLARIYRP